MPRYYTLTEANAMLPRLTGMLRQLQAVVRQKGMVDARAADVATRVRSNGHHNPIEDPTVTQAASSLDNAMRSLLAQLDEWEIELKDLSTGLVDFRALREGREVYLCWRLDEAEIAFWHELTTGFAGRMPVDEKTQ